MYVYVEIVRVCMYVQCDQDLNVNLGLIQVVVFWEVGGGWRRRFKF